MLASCSPCALGCPGDASHRHRLGRGLPRRPSSSTSASSPELRDRAWWLPPFVSSVISSALDTAIFFSVAFYCGPVPGVGTHDSDAPGTGRHRGCTAWRCRGPTSRWRITASSCARSPFHRTLRGHPDGHATPGRPAGLSRFRQPASANSSSKVRWMPLKLSSDTMVSTVSRPSRWIGRPSMLSIC